MLGSERYQYLYSVGKIPFDLLSEMTWRPRVLLSVHERTNGRYQPTAEQRPSERSQRQWLQQQRTVQPRQHDRGRRLSQSHEGVAVKAEVERAQTRHR